MQDKKEPWQKRRQTRIDYCEWNSESMGHYNTGGIICECCNFSRPLMRGESHGHYGTNNKIERLERCPKCQDNQNWYFLPPIARVPKKTANKQVWKRFWNDLKNREFNHPKHGCR